MELEQVGMQFHQTLLRSLLTEPSEAEVRDAFSRIAPLPHLHKLRDSLLVFIRHFVAVKMDGPSKKDKNAALINQRIKMVEHVFKAPDQLR